MLRLGQLSIDLVFSFLLFTIFLVFCLKYIYTIPKPYEQMAESSEILFYSIYGNRSIHSYAIAFQIPSFGCIKNLCIFEDRIFIRCENSSLNLVIKAKPLRVEKIGLEAEDLIKVGNQTEVSLICPNDEDLVIMKFEPGIHRMLFDLGKKGKELGGRSFILEDFRSGPFLIREEQRIWMGS